MRYKTFCTRTPHVVKSKTSSAIKQFHDLNVLLRRESDRDLASY